MKKLSLFKIGSDYNPLVRSFAIFLIIIAVMMFINSFAVVFDSWQVIRDFDTCVVDSRIIDYKTMDVTTEQKVLSQLQFQDCKSSLKDITGAQIPPNQTFLTTRQKITALTFPVAILFIYAALLLFAINLYLSASFVLPIEETQVALRPFKELKQKNAPVRAFKKKK
ncbi:MAG: hypothetical protein PHQ98_00560 [Candidatus ainarchaeum sp.]|nr:hypothetical protein [Candidatus ainarchaeum sp.]